MQRLGHEVTVYPDAEEYMNRVLYLERIRSKVSEKNTQGSKNHPLTKDPSQSQLLPYQLDGIAFAAGAGRAVLADDMGLGKTIQGIGVAELLSIEAGISKVLVVCPASLKSHWRLDILRFSDRNCQLILGSTEERLPNMTTPAFTPSATTSKSSGTFLPLKE